MLKIIVFLIIGVIISYFELWPLVTKKWWKEGMIGFLLLSLALIFAILMSNNVVIPTPINFIEKLYRPIVSYTERLLS